MATEEKKHLMLGIEKEFGGDQTLWLDVDEPEMLCAYIKDNLDLDHKYTFTLTHMTDAEVKELE